MDFSQAIVNGIPLILVIWGLIAFAKAMGVSGKWLTGLSMSFGLALGAAYQVSTHGLPVGFAGWFGVLIYGLGLGIVASGLYDVVKRDWLPQVGMGDWADGGPADPPKPDSAWVDTSEL